jgi:hypothetical protein
MTTMEAAMSQREAFEQGDEAFDEAARLNPNFTEEVELDPALDPNLLADERELEEVGATFDDPELMVTLDGGLDDPDGIGPPGASPSDSGGWELDAPLVAGPDDEEPGEATGA